MDVSISLFLLSDWLLGGLILEVFWLSILFADFLLTLLILCSCLFV